MTRGIWEYWYGLWVCIETPFFFILPNLQVKKINHFSLIYAYGYTLGKQTRCDREWMITLMNCTFRYFIVNRSNVRFPFLMLVNFLAQQKEGENQRQRERERENGIDRKISKRQDLYNIKKKGAEVRSEYMCS